MQENKKDVLARWEDYKQSQSGNEPRLKFSYNKVQEKKKAMILEAIIFWKFVVNELQSEMTWVTCKKMQELLAVFIKDGNVLIRLVAMIESLPTSVWRKILWRYNLDFMSHESFLRRINYEQRMEVAYNYGDLYELNAIPRAFSKWDRFWGKLSVEKFFVEEFDSSARYRNKAAMSYNLFGLDFGFNAYPGGVNDDNKVVEVSPLRFLSEKKGADDFEVNTEAGGKYFWFYRTARSNYVINSDKHVELKSHICPGFWYTWFIHLMFWVISPAFAIYLLATITPAISVWKFIFFGAIGVMTPLWLGAALLKFTFPKVFDAVGDAADYVGEHEPLKTGLSNGSKTILAGVLSKLAFEYLFPAFGTVWSGLIILAFLVYFGYKIYTKKKHYGYAKFSRFPWYLRLPLMAMAAGMFVRFCVTYPKEIIAFYWFVIRVAVALFHFIVDCLIGIWEVLVLMGATSFMLLIPLVLGAATWYITNNLDEKKQEKMLDWLFYFVGCCLFGVLVTAMVLAYKLVGMSILLFGFFLLLTVCFLAEWLVIWSLNPRVKETVETVKYSKKYTSHNVEINRFMLLRNSWLRTLDKESKENILRRAIRLTMETLDDSHEWLAYWTLLPNLTSEILDALEEKKEAFKQLYYRYNYSYRLPYKVFKKMSKGLAYEDALAEAMQEKNREDVFRAGARKVWRGITYPFRMIAKLAEHGRTLYRLYDLLNKRCPIVTKRRVLEM